VVGFYASSLNGNTLKAWLSGMALQLVFGFAVFVVAALASASAYMPGGASLPRAVLAGSFVLFAGSSFLAWSYLNYGKDAELGRGWPMQIFSSFTVGVAAVAAANLLMTIFHVLLRPWPWS
jgi:hypothetical protein